MADFESIERRLERIENVLSALTLPKTEKYFYSTDEAAGRLKLSKWYIRRLCSLGEIRDEKHPESGRFLISAKEMERIETRRDALKRCQLKKECMTNEKPVFEMKVRLIRASVFRNITKDGRPFFNTRIVMRYQSGANEDHAVLHEAIDGRGSGQLVLEDLVRFAEGKVTRQQHAPTSIDSRQQLKIDMTTLWHFSR